MGPATAQAVFADRPHAFPGSGEATNAHRTERTQAQYGGA